MTGFRTNDTNTRTTLQITSEALIPALKEEVATSVGKGTKTLFDCLADGIGQRLVQIDVELARELCCQVDGDLLLRGWVSAIEKPLNGIRGFHPVG
jgi:hypothetical protein